MRPIWKGALTFGLVNIPVGLYSATTRSALSFRLLHAKDQAPIAYRRVCSEENVEVPWPEIVKGYEYEKGQFVVMTEADFEQADVEATQTIDIRDFVRSDAIPATYFEQPYYLEPQQTGTKAYALLREALKRSERIGVATLVLRQREHLAAVQPAGEALTLTTSASRTRSCRRAASRCPATPASTAARSTSRCSSSTRWPVSSTPRSIAISIATRCSRSSSRSSRAARRPHRPRASHPRRSST